MDRRELLEIMTLTLGGSLTYMALTARAADHAVSEMRKGNL